jgi:hypothetical protein
MRWYQPDHQRVLSQWNVDVCNTLDLYSGLHQAMNPMIEAPVGILPSADGALCRPFSWAAAGLRTDGANLLASPECTTLLYSTGANHYVVLHSVHTSGASRAATCVDYGWVGLSRAATDTRHGIRPEPQLLQPQWPQLSCCDNAALEAVPMTVLAGVITVQSQIRHQYAASSPRTKSRQSPLLM